MEFLVHSLNIITKYLILCGFFSYKVENNFKSSKSRMLYCLIVNLIVSVEYLIIGYFCRTIYSDYLDDFSKTTEFFNYLEPIISSINFFLMIYTAVFTSKQQIDLFKKFENFDLKLPHYLRSNEKLIKFKRFSKVHSSRQFIFLCSFYILLSVLYITGYSNHKQSYFLIPQIINYDFLMGYVMSLLIMIQFLTILLTKYLEIINDYLQKFLNFQIISKEISILVKLSLEIKKLAFDFFRYFGVIVIWIIIYTTNNNSIQFYFFYLRFYNQKWENLEDYFFLIMGTIWYLPIIFAIYKVGTAFALLKYECETTKNLLRETYRHSKFIDKFLMDFIGNDELSNANGFIEFDDSITFKVIIELLLELFFNDLLISLLDCSKYIFNNIYHHSISFDGTREQN